MPRHEATTAALDSEEQEWWADNGDLEEGFSWVQTPLARRVLRGHYLRRARRFVGPGANVLELGCGTGWLGLDLIRTADCRLLGIDSSPEQIRRARAAASAAGLEARASYAVAGSPEAEAATAGTRFDAVVTHAFLHHLSTREIESVLDESRSLLQPGGALVVLEPVVGAEDPVSVASAQATGGSDGWLRLQQRLRHLPRWSAEHRLRRMGPLELQTRRRLESRPLPEPPFGPSPKETPFRAGELESLLHDAGFSVAETAPVLCMSHLVAEDVLLAALSQPRFWTLATAPLLGMAHVADRRLLRSADRPPGLWVFTLYLCRRQH